MVVFLSQVIHRKAKTTNENYRNTQNADDSHHDVVAWDGSQCRPHMQGDPI